MGKREQVQKLLELYQPQPGVRTASFPPFSKEGPPEPPGGAQKRNIPKDHPYDPRALKPMAKALWAASVGLGHALAAYRHFSRLKSATVSPDGQLGGRGYVMGITDIRKKLYDACESLSAISDTLYDELAAPHWKPKLAQLSENDAEDVQRFVEESQDIMADPEDDAEKEIKEIEEENDEPGSKMPDSGGVASDEAEQPRKEKDPNAGLENQGIKQASWKVANSSYPVDTLPGPRVDHLGPAEGEGPFGTYNDQSDFPLDKWVVDESAPGKTYDYNRPAEDIKDLHSARFLTEDEVRERGRQELATSVLPEDTKTETEAWDFGLGYGAHGQGAGDYVNPSGEGSGYKGVEGPSSMLPSLPSLPGDDNTPRIDVELNSRHALDTLPQDVVRPVTRRDEYEGPKDNTLVQSESELPSLPQNGITKELSLVDTGEKWEDVTTPYVRYDYTTHTLREGPFTDLQDKNG